MFFLLLNIGGEFPLHGCNFAGNPPTYPYHDVLSKIEVDCGSIII